MVFSYQEMREFVQLPDYTHCLECYAPVLEGQDPPFCSDRCFHVYMMHSLGIG